MKSTHRTRFLLPHRRCEGGYGAATTRLASHCQTVTSVFRPLLNGHEAIPRREGLVGTGTGSAAGPGLRRRCAAWGLRPIAPRGGCAAPVRWASHFLRHVP